MKITLIYIGGILHLALALFTQIGMKPQIEKVKALLEGLE